MFKLTLNERNECASFTLVDICNADKLVVPRGFEPLH